MAGARHFSHMIVWQLGDELRVEVFKLTGRPCFDQNLKARSQIDDAVNSVCRDIAEGFACESHREFARFVSISRRSLNELLDGLRGAVQRGCLSQADLQPSHSLARRLFPAMSRLLAYLRTTPGPTEAPPRRRNAKRQSH
jgi:four helix bundle protein